MKTKTVFNNAKRTLLYVILVISSIIMIFPFLWMLSTSFKTSAGVFSYPPQFIPEPFHFANYKKIWTLVPFALGFLNSFKVTFSVVFLQLFTASLAAYAFSKLKFRGREKIFICIIATMMIPEQVTMIPLFLMFKQLNLLDSLAAIILPFAFNFPFGVFLLRQFVAKIPDELTEAAHIDGANVPIIYAVIILPMCKSAISALAVFSFLGSWNNFLYPLLFLNTREKFTLQLMVSTLKGHFYTDWSLLMTGSAISILPVLIVYLICQKQIIEGIAITGLKG